MIQATAKFLSDTEWEEFRQPGRRIVRRAREETANHVGPRVKLTAAISDAIAVLAKTRSPGGTFAGIGVAVRERDGRSWVAEEAAVHIAETRGNFEQYCLAGRSLATDSWPLISRIIGRKRFLKRVVAHRLSKSFPSFSPWLRWTLAIVAVAVVLMASVASQWLNVQVAKGFTVDVIPRLLAAAVAATLMALLSTRLLDRLSARPSRNAVKRLRAELEEAAGRNDPAFDNLITDLAKSLASGQFPRAILIDDYERLDLVTRRVIERYMDVVAPPLGGAEIWIAFERTSGERLSLRPARHEDYFHGFRHFRLEPLDIDERASLAKKMGHPERASYATVGSIAGSDSDACKGYLETLKGYLLKNPRRENTYSDLDLLCLLWLNAEGGYENLERDFVVSNLARKKEASLPYQLLARFLVGTGHRIPEFEKALDRLGEGLGSTALLESRSSAGVIRITVNREAGLGFDAAKNELGKLPPRGLGHLFWSVFWFDRLQNHPVEAFWIRKLAHHLLEADPEIIQDKELYRKTLERQVEALLYTIGGALTTCIYAPLPRLLQRAVADVLELGVEDGLRRRLRSLCWEVYSLAGTEEALGGYLRLQRAATTVLAEPPTIDPTLADLFVETLELPAGDRATLRHALAASAAGTGREDVLPSYVELRSAGFAIALSRAAQTETSSLAAEQEAAREALRTGTARLTARLDSFADAEVAAVTATDLLSLSILLWRLPELVHIEEEKRSPVKEMNLSLLTASDGEANAVETQCESGLNGEEGAPTEALDLFLETVETAVLFGDALQGRLTKEAGADLIRFALARELLGVAFGALAIAAHAARSLHLRPREAPLLRRLEGVLRVATDHLSEEPIGLNDLDDLCSASFLQRADQLLEQSAFVWRQFSLPTLETTAHARRVELIALETASPEELWRRSAPLRDALHDKRSRSDLANINALLALAFVFRRSAELRADHFLEATEIVLEGSFGDRLKDEFAFQAIGLGHHLGVDLGRAIDHLVLARADANETPLAGHLATVADREVQVLALRLLNSSATGTGKDAREALRGILRKHIVENRSPEVGQSIENLLDFFDFKDELEEDEAINATTVIESWKERRDSWTYAAVLNLLVVPGRSEEIVVEEGLAVLERTSWAESYNSFLFLALGLTRHLALTEVKPSLDELPASYVLRALPMWEPSLPASTNAQAFQILDLLSGGSVLVFKQKAEHWGAIKLQHDETSKLVPMLRESRFGSIFLYYLELLLSWELRMDKPPEEFYKEFHAEPEERRQRVATWVTSGRQIPQPFATLPGGRRVPATAYAVLGKDLFTPPIVGDSTLDADRRRFTESARKATIQLLRTSAKLAAMPNAIRDLVQRYAQRFDNRTRASELGS